jgi:hypothetical protein
LDKARSSDRRSFLATVAGGGLLLGAGLFLGAGQATQPQAGRPRRARMIVDRDPRDPARPLPAPQPQQQQQQLPMPPPSENMMATVEPHHGRARASPTQRFVICPGNRRCPR